MKPAPFNRHVPRTLDEALGRPGAVMRLPVSPQRLKALMAQT
jgi:uncharacterized protein YcgL (UPF0745 family)